MTTTPFFRWLPVAAVLAMAPLSVSALSVYDIIQLKQKNYDDQTIIDLIKATDSAFKLKADDIIRLKELGISESVMQTMLKATHKEPDLAPDNHSPSPSTTSNASSHHASIEPSSAGDIVLHNTTTAFVVPNASRLFDSSLFKEANSGHHDHNAINLMGIRLLVLRDEGVFSSVATRADTIVTRLEQAVTAGEGSFHSGRSATDNAIMFYPNGADNPLIILNVSRSDASAYQLRSGRKVTPEQLAAYWSDLLSDYWSIVINSVAPDRLADLHEGEVLKALHEQWQKSNETESAQLADAAQLLPRPQQQHLLRLAMTVPRDFLINTSHQVKQP